jgi:cytoskeletal protein CcmA (bactofilin family)
LATGGSADQGREADKVENQEQKEAVEASCVSVVGANIVITGNIEPVAGAAAVDLQIEGRVHGDVRCATLVLGETGSIKGSVYSDRARLAGTIEGAIDTKDLAIEATARVSGDIAYERLRVANGAIVEGQMKWRSAAKDAGEGGNLKLVTQPAAAAEAKPKVVYIE